MNKTLLFVALLTVFMLAACGASGYQIAIEESPTFQGETPSVIAFKISEDDEPATGLTVNASFEMAKMDHGHIEVPLEETEDGIYRGEVTLPMAGEWLADVKAEKGKKEAEELLTIIVEER